MKSKKILYLGYLIAVVALICTFVFKEYRTVKIISLFIFTISFAATHVQRMHIRMMEKDKSYRVNVNDERNEKIRDKVNAEMCGILMFSNLIIGAIAFIFEENIAAILLYASVIISPLLMLLFSRHFERKY